MNVFYYNGENLKLNCVKELGAVPTKQQGQATFLTLSGHVVMFSLSRDHIENARTCQCSSNCKCEVHNSSLQSTRIIGGIT